MHLIWRSKAPLNSRRSQLCQNNRLVYVWGLSQSIGWQQQPRSNNLCIQIEIELIELNVKWQIVAQAKIKESGINKDFMLLQTGFVSCEMREYSLWNTADIIGSISYKIHYFFLVLQCIIIYILKLRNRHKICFDLTYYSIVVEMHHNYLWYSIQFLVFFWYFYTKQIPLIRRPMTMPFSRATWHNYASSRKGKGKFWNLNRMLTIRNTRASHTESERERDKCMRILLAVTVSGRVGRGVGWTSSHAIRA